MAIGLMQAVDRIEQSGADHWRDKYPERATQGDEIANLYGVMRIWMRITCYLYLVALVMMLVPVGGALRYIGVLLWTLGIAPLICWRVAKMQYKKAVKQFLNP